MEGFDTKDAYGGTVKKDADGIDHYYRTVAAKRKDNPDMTKAEVKKASQQALAQARSSVGAKRSNIEITDKGIC